MEPEVIYLVRKDLFLALTFTISNRVKIETVSIIIFLVLCLVDIKFEIKFQEH